MYLYPFERWIRVIRSEPGHNDPRRLIQREGIPGKETNCKVTELARGVGSDRKASEDLRREFFYFGSVGDCNLVRVICRKGA